jgi:hypothetical protein
MKSTYSYLDSGPLAHLRKKSNETIFPGPLEEERAYIISAFERGLIDISEVTMWLTDYYGIDKPWYFLVKVSSIAS